MAVDNVNVVEFATPRGVADIGQAIRWMKEGQRVRREGWNGKGMWLAYVAGDGWGCSYRTHPMDETAPQLKQPLFPFIVMKTSDNSLVPWLASQTDLLATDWTPVGREG